MVTDLVNKFLQEAHILVLELCERGELCNLLLKETPLPPAVCQEYFRQLMSGIEYCHGKIKIIERPAPFPEQC